MLMLNGKEIKPTIFPDGTSQVWKIQKEDHNMIQWYFEDEAEIIQLAQLRELVEKGSLHAPYLPYARQDKDIDNSSTFALRSFAKILNSLDFSFVLTFDVHSNVAQQLIPNLAVYSPKTILNSILHNFDYICYPDKGALERYHYDKELVKYQFDKKFIIGHKERDQQTGRITHYHLEGELESHSRVLVVDDLCDGGATFEILGKALKDKNADCSLYVSHGIFSKGTGHLRNYYSNIFTTNSVIFNHKYTQDKGIIRYESAPPHRLLQS